MSKIDIKVTELEYDQFKNKVLSQELIKRYDVSSKDIEFDTLSGLTIKGNIIKLEKSALTALSKSLGMSKIVVDTISSAYGNNEGVLKSIMGAIKDRKAKEFTLVFNTKSRSITNVYVKGSKLISDYQYFETLEKVIARTPGAHLRSINQTDEGDIKATISNPRLEFDFNRLADEVFTAGMTLELSNKEMLTSFFTERLVCTNGMVAEQKLCSMSVNVKDKVPDFMAAILDADYHINSIGEFKKRLLRCYNTTASLGEVLNTEHRIRQILGDTAIADGLISEMSARHLREAFGVQYLENKAIHKYLKTDMTLWELVNETTAISASIEQRGLPVSEDQNRKIQMLGGDRMFRLPDLAPNNIKQIFK